VSLKNRFFSFLCLAALCATSLCAQGAPQDAGSAPPQQGQGQGQGHGWQGQNGPRPTVGKITAIHDGVIELATPDGATVTVKTTGDTEFRKDRQPAKPADFKVGDLVMVRGDENPDHTITAKVIGARTGGAAGGGQRGGGPRAMFAGGTLGKDYVLGQVKSIDPPRITVVRTDNVTQTLELNEDTTLRRGRDSITMADIQVGEHIAAHGGVQGEVFVPKDVRVMSAEQWQRMQEFMGMANGGDSGNAGSTAPKH
jgi:Domain of unknown function (DUF5666)